MAEAAREAEFKALLMDYAPVMSASPTRIVEGGETYSIQLSANRYLDDAEVSPGGAIAGMRISSVEHPERNKLIVELAGTPEQGEGTLTLKTEGEELSASVNVVDSVCLMGTSDADTVELVDGNGNTVGSAQTDAGIFSLRVTKPLSTRAATVRDSMGRSYKMDTFDADRNFVKLSSKTIKSDVPGKDPVAPDLGPDPLGDAIEEMIEDFAEPDAAELLDPTDQEMMAGIKDLKHRMKLGTAFSVLGVVLSTVKKLFVPDKTTVMLEEILEKLNQLEEEMMDGFARIEQIEMQNEFNTLMQPVLDCAAIVKTRSDVLNSIADTADTLSVETREMMVQDLANLLYQDDYDLMLQTLTEYMTGGGGTQSIPEVYREYLMRAYPFEHQIYQPCVDFYNYMSTLVIMATNLHMEYYTSISGPYDPLSEFMTLADGCYGKAETFICNLYDQMNLGNLKPVEECIVNVEYAAGEFYRVKANSTGEVYYLPIHFNFPVQTSYSYDNTSGQETFDCRSDADYYLQGDEIWVAANGTDIDEIAALAPSGTINYETWLKNDCGLDNIGSLSKVITHVPKKDYLSTSKVYLYDVGYVDMRNGNERINTDSRAIYQDYGSHSITVTCIYQKRPGAEGGEQ